MVARRLVKAAAAALAAFELRGLIRDLPPLLRLLEHVPVRDDLCIVTPALILAALLLGVAGGGLSGQFRLRYRSPLRLATLWAASTAALLVLFCADAALFGHLGAAHASAGDPAWSGLPAAMGIAALVSAALEGGGAVLTRLGSVRACLHWITRAVGQWWAAHGLEPRRPALCAGGLSERGPPRL